MNSSPSLGFTASLLPLGLHRTAIKPRSLCVSGFARLFTTPITRPNRLTRLSPVSSSPRVTTVSSICHQTQGSPIADEADDPPDDPSLTETFRVSSHEHGERIDRAIAERYGERSRTYVQKLLSAGCVRVNDREMQSKSFRLTESDVITVKFTPQQKDVELQGEDIPLDVLYEDSHIAVINKPAGMVVHPSAGHWSGTLVHALCFRYPQILSSPSSQHRPGIVHRLDKGTSGAIVVARTPEAHMRLSERFRLRQVRKEYVAITIGNPCGKTGRENVDIDVPIGRNGQDRMKMIVDTPLTNRICINAKEAKTSVHKLSHDANGLLHAARIQLHTGRTHQIRVHLQHIRTPVLGDDLYGRLDVNKRFISSAQRPMLHAQLLHFMHPIDENKVVKVTAPLPDDMKQLMRNVVYPDFEQHLPDW